ncbi:PML-RARA-regulated adapter molecule 1 isoform X3 [Tympanuchus pallidicinctus]|uniref:PML-RARA-regulated adapter molecule 1 isoform X3 n=1 Tax=Tympanuchus pallidicinctus TaxID=109042 RepID=UPI0022871C5C|nr:PML-RARA-regulated adapter molecule 1 isoform X3 [Tympanuchus pallidicinctus]
MVFRREESSQGSGRGWEMENPEGKEAAGRHLRAKLKDGRKPPPAAGGRARGPPSAFPATEPGRALTPGSKGEPPPASPLAGRVGVGRAPPPRSEAQSEGPGSRPMPVPQSPEWMARLKKGVVPRAASQPPASKPGGRDAADDKGVGATSHPPPRIPAPHKWPLLNDAAAPALPAAGAAAAGGIRGSGQTPRRKPLPHVAVLGARPAKPRRPPGVDLEKFHRAAAPGEPGRTAVGSRSAVLGYPAPFPPRDALSTAGGEEEIYDDVESVELLRRDRSFSPPPTFRPPAHLHPRGGGGAARAPSTVALLVAAQRGAQSSRKVKPMTLKECKKEEKADREFQKKFKFEGNIAVLTQMMVDPATTEKRGGGKNLPLRRGEILDVIQFTNKEQILCRNSQRRYGYVPRAVMLHLDRDIYDDVDLYGRCE